MRRQVGIHNAANMQAEERRRGHLEFSPRAMLIVGLWLFQSMREKKRMRLKETIKTTPGFSDEKPTESERKNERER